MGRHAIDPLTSQSHLPERRFITIPRPCTGLCLSLAMHRFWYRCPPLPPQADTTCERSAVPQSNLLFINPANFSLLFHLLSRAVLRDFLQKSKRSIPTGKLCTAQPDTHPLEGLNCFLKHLPSHKPITLLQTHFKNKQTTKKTRAWDVHTC